MFEYRTNDFQIGLRLPSGNVVDRTRRGLVERQVDRAAEVLHEKPIPLLQTVAVDRKGLVFECIGNHERDQLLRELKWAKIVRAAENDRGNSIGVGVGLDEMFC